MDVFSYKGFQGAAVHEDGNLFIHILNVKDFISTQCGPIENAETVFQALVDDYLLTCQEIGRDPQRFS